jgi:transposase
MKLSAYQELIGSERYARKYLLRKCFKNHQQFCTHCRQRKLYRLADDRYRCSRCDYSFHDFSGRWINSGRLTAVQWRWIFKLFELEVSVRKMALQLGLCYRCGWAAVTGSAWQSCTMPKMSPACCAARSISMRPTSAAGVKASEAETAGKVPVFGILKRDGQDHVSVVADVSAATFLDLTVKKLSRGSIVYTDRLGSYDSLMFCGCRQLQADHHKLFSSGRVYINSLKGF